MYCNVNMSSRARSHDLLRMYKVEDFHVRPTSHDVTSSARYGKYLTEKLWSLCLALA